MGRIGADRAQFTVWFPIHLYRVINLVYPRVDPYTELGTKRSTSELDREYQRLLDRDKNPLQFLYHGARSPFPPSHLADSPQTTGAAGRRTRRGTCSRSSPRCSSSR